MKLTDAQRRLLATIPDELTHFQRGHWGVRSILGNQTIRVLKERGLIEVLTVPPRWRRTDAGRAALSSHSDAKTAAAQAHTAGKDQKP